MNILLPSISPLDRAAMAAAQARQSTLTKPPGSLGRLEALSVQLAGMTGQPLPHLRHKVIVVMAADHGVVVEGVSAYPQEVTAQMVGNFLAGGAAINVLARHVGARVVVVDMGVAAALSPHPQLRCRRIGPGTANMAAGPAMSRQQALAALQAGMDIAAEVIAEGADIVATGEMGIGNTTAAAAVACALGGFAPAAIVGRGTGLDDEGLQRKVAVVARALAVNRPASDDGIDVLAKVGGFEIGGLAGLILAAAARRVPVMLDGFIATAAAMVAVQLAPACRDYLIAAHCSQEAGHRAMLDWLALRPLLDLDLRLGEGTGAALGLNLAEAACKLLAEMATFAEAGVRDRL